MTHESIYRQNWHTKLQYSRIKNKLLLAIMCEASDDANLHFQYLFWPHFTHFWAENSISLVMFSPLFEGVSVGEVCGLAGDRLQLQVGQKVVLREQRHDAVGSRHLGLGLVGR